jgi:hypothetical protein
MCVSMWCNPKLTLAVPRLRWGFCGWSFLNTTHELNVSVLGGYCWAFDAYRVL